MDTKVDVSVTIVDLDEINAVDGDFRVKFKIHAIYKFDMKQKKEAVRLLPRISQRLLYVTCN